MNRNTQHIQKGCPPRRRRVVTLAEVAQVAGVAPSTASAVLGGNGCCYASEKTRRKIFEAAQKMNYRPNPHSRGLQGLPTQKIGVLLGALGQSTMAIQILAIETVAAENSYRLLFGTHRGSNDREDEYLLGFESDLVDGLIVAPCYRHPADHAMLREIIHRGTPLVTIDSTVQVNAPNVVTDRETGGYLQVRHVLEIGRKRPAFLLTGLGSVFGELKIAGIRRALGEAGMSLDEFPQVIDNTSIGLHGVEFGAKMAKELLASGAKFDSLITLGDHIAIGAMRVFSQAGMLFPDDVAVVGFNDEPGSANIAVPLTSIRQMHDQVGRKAFELLLAQLRCEMPVGHYTEVRLLPQLIIRQSSFGASCDDSIAGSEIC